MTNMKYIFSVFILFIVISCGEVVDREVEEIVRYHSDKTHISEIEWITDIEIIPLETKDNCFIGDNPGLFIYKDNYYVTDKKSNTVLRFDSQGKYLNQIGTQGRGPQEYISLKSVEIDPKEDILHIYSIIDEEIYSYDLEGKFLNKIKLPYQAQQVLSSDANRYFYLGYKNQYFDETLVEIDNKHNKLKNKYLTFTANVISVQEEEAVMSLHPEGMYVKETLNNDIYRIRDGQEVIAYRFDYGEYSIPRRYYEMKDPFTAGDYLFEREFASHPMFFKNSEYVVLVSIIQKRSDLIIAYALKNIVEDKWIWCNYSQKNDSDDIFFGSLKYLSQDSYLYFMVEPHKFISSDLTDSKKVKNPEIISKINAGDNHVVLKCRLR